MSVSTDAHLKISSLDVSNAFRDAVANLLRASNRDVRVEVLVGSKKVDVLYIERRLGGTLRVAIECKNYGRPVTRNQIVNIHADLMSLYDDRLIDEIHIVTPQIPSPAAQKYVEEVRYLKHYAFKTLQESVMDFSFYLQHLMEEFKSDGLDKYFIKPRLSDNQDFESYVDRWLIGKDDTPLAVLGGYGMGKTTFAKYIAARTAEAK